MSRLPGISSSISSPLESAPRTGLGAASIAYTEAGGSMSFGTQTSRDTLRGASEIGKQDCCLVLKPLSL